MNMVCKSSGPDVAVGGVEFEMEGLGFSTYIGTLVVVVIIRYDEA